MKAFYSPTWNPTPWVYNSEMFDQNVRTLAQAFAAMNNCKYLRVLPVYQVLIRLAGFWNFMVSRFTPQMFTSMGYGVYFFFASLMICSVVFIYFLMPETKNIPLEGIDRLFDRRLKASQAHAIVWKELREEEEALRVGLTSGTMEKDTATAQIEDVEQKV